MRPFGYPLALRDGGTLRLFLTMLLVLPLLGLCATAGLEVRSRVTIERAATHAQVAVRAVAEIDAVRAGIQREIVPTIALAIMRNPSLLERTPTAADIQEATDAVVGLTGLQAGTDAALTTLRSGHADRADIDAIAADTRKIRQVMSAPTDLGTSFLGALSVLTSMGSIENQQIAAASTAGLNPAGVQALRDVGRTAEAIEAAGFEVPMYVSTLYPHLIINVANTYVPWIQRWALATVASTAVASDAASPVRQQWIAANQDPQIKAFNAALAADALGTGALSVAQHKQVLATDARRNTLYLAVLDTSFTRALSAGSEQRSQARSDLIWITATCLAIIALSLLAAVLIRRSVIRPLNLLTTQARRISRGDLSQVPISGPHEIRTVARALAGSVANLRNVEAQAAAVATGDLDNAVLLKPLPGPLGAAMHSSITQIITAFHEREQAQQALAHQASHDALTGLPNRAQALLEITQALHRGQRSSVTTVLMFIDLDYFKAVNDAFGHAAGDGVLQTVAQRMQGAVREGDTVARLGGDEFVALMENFRDKAAVIKLAERIVASISEPITVEDHVVHVGASIGIAFCQDGSIDADRLLREADTAAYRAKSAGRNRVDVFDDALRRALSDRATLERAILHALRNEQFVLYYQPVVVLATATPVAVEAQIHWQRPGFGLLAAADFMPAARDAMLTDEIERWMLGEATRQLRRWQQHDPATSGLIMGVNISGRRLTNPRLLSEVNVALAAAGIAANRLVLQVTETGLIHEEVTRHNLAALRASGVRISIDDFGIGLTSIRQLVDLKVDCLKIDRSFMATRDTQRLELIRLITGTAHALGLHVLACGIETVEQAETMRTLNVNAGQGAYFGPPCPPGELIETLLAQPTLPASAATAPAHQPGWVHTVAVASPQRPGR